MWLLITYKVPNEPSARRVYVWRKLKKIGALLLHDAVWVLPLNERTREQMQWLAVEIRDFGGEAHVWESSLILDGQDAQLVQQFNAQVDEAYGEILAGLDHSDADLEALSRRYQQVQLQDYFQSALGKKVREALLKARGDEV